MTNDVLEALLRVNLVAAAAVAAVLALRTPARRLFGPEVAYRLWAAPPLAALATLLPAPIADEAPAANAIVEAMGDASGPMLALWAAGAAAAIALLTHAQARFLAAMRRGEAGPAVVGVVAPRLVMPTDDGAFSPQERELIRTHERTHIARGDPRAGALAAALQALFWFNPFVHLGAQAMRLDQELACDAAVLRSRPRERALYARTLLKSQLASQQAPFGCHWMAHPLEVRIGALGAARFRDGLAGPLLISAALAGAVWSGWRVNPPDPPPAAMVEFWKAQHKPVMSVMLVPPPARAPDA